MDEFLIYGEPVKGWTLIRAMKKVPHAKMKAGEWALAFSEFFFTKKNFLPSFYFNDIPNDLDVLNSEVNEKDMETYMRSIDTFENCMKVDPQIGYAFYSACLDDGFDPMFNDFYIFVAERIAKCARNGQAQLSETQLNILMNIFVAKEEYEKAALVRDTLNKKNVTKIF